MKRDTLSFRISFLIFIALAFNHCHSVEQETSVSTISKNDKVVGLKIRGPALSEDDLPSRLNVQLIKQGKRAGVLGDYKINDDEIIFESLVPLTRGLSYEILLDDSVIAKLAIPLGTTSAPELLSIYPTQDTLPENLLKMYFEFSEPMVEGNSLSNIVLLKNSKDTVEGIFLDLKPELWNQEGTVLTLWLDPGRIKRDLIPNKELGNPLVAGKHYTLHVESSWKSKRGIQLTKAIAKSFFTTKRDDISPQSQQWEIVSPRSNTRDPLVVKFHESLDVYILKETARIEDDEKELMAGAIEILDEERILHFTPTDLWDKGKFTFTVETKLEDLSGNNLNRPFDEDIEMKSRQVGVDQKLYSIKFEIQ
jgi:hypothetical protein